MSKPAISHLTYCRIPQSRSMQTHWCRDLVDWSFRCIDFWGLNFWRWRILLWETVSWMLCWCCCLYYDGITYDCLIVRGVDERVWSGKIPLRSEIHQYLITNQKQLVCFAYFYYPLYFFFAPKSACWVVRIAKDHYFSLFGFLFKISEVDLISRTISNLIIKESSLHYFSLQKLHNLHVIIENRGKDKHSFSWFGVLLDKQIDSIEQRWRNGDILLIYLYFRLFDMSLLVPFNDVLIIFLRRILVSEVIDRCNPLNNLLLQWLIQRKIHIRNGKREAIFFIALPCPFLWVRYTNKLWH